MAVSLWGAVQVTLRAGAPDLTSLDSATPATWPGTIYLMRITRCSDDQYNNIIDTIQSGLVVQIDRYTYMIV